MAWRCRSSVTLAQHASHAGVCPALWTQSERRRMEPRHTAGEQASAHSAVAAPRQLLPRRSAYVCPTPSLSRALRTSERKAGNEPLPLDGIRALSHPARDSAQKRTSPTRNSFCGKPRTKSTLSTGARSTGTQLEYSQSIRLPITGNRKHHRTHFEYPTNTYRSVPLLCCRTPCVGEPPGCGVHAHACLQLIPRGLAAQLCSGGPARAPPRRHGAPGKHQSACSPGADVEVVRCSVCELAM